VGRYGEGGIVGRESVGTVGIEGTRSGDVGVLEDDDGVDDVTARAGYDVLRANYKDIVENCQRQCSEMQMFS
jgi:hypothetical protein